MASPKTPRQRFDTKGISGAGQRSRIIDLRIRNAKVDTLQLDEVLAVILQLINRLIHIRQCLMPGLFLEALDQLGLPAPAQLLERADIQIAVMKERLELRHIAEHEAAILADGVAAER